MFTVKVVPDGDLMVCCSRCGWGTFYEKGSLYAVRRLTGEHAEHVHGYKGFFKWRGYVW